MVPVKKTSPGSMAVNTVGSSSGTSAGLTAGSTPNIFAAASATPKSMINTTGMSCTRLLACTYTVKIPHLSPCNVVHFQIILLQSNLCA